MISESDIRQIKDLLEESDRDRRFLLCEPMSRHTSFGVGGPAEVFIDAAGEEPGRLVPFLREKGIPYIVVGAGSNLLVSDDGIPGVVIAIGKRMSETCIEGDRIVAGAGALLPALANLAAENELSGLEFAAGIPGTLGGAIAMNAGAYGGEIKDVIKSVSILNEKGELIEMSLEECRFSYRHSLFSDKPELTVVSAVLQLEKKPGGQEEIRALMKENMEKRRSSQPVEFRSAGSTFKRVDTGAGDAAADRRPAWKLIQEAGCKGLTVGGAQVSEKHCGFIINKGSATATDILTLIHKVADAVQNESGVFLEPEVKLVGF